MYSSGVRYAPIRMTANIVSDALARNRRWMRATGLFAE